MDSWWYPALVMTSNSPGNCEGLSTPLFKEYHNPTLLLTNVILNANFSNSTIMVQLLWNTHPYEFVTMCCHIKQYTP